METKRTLQLPAIAIQPTLEGMGEMVRSKIYRDNPDGGLEELPQTASGAYIFLGRAPRVFCPSCACGHSRASSHLFQN